MSRVDDLLYSLRRQYPTGVTTWSLCSRWCGKPARGGAACKDCLTKELIALGADQKSVTGYVDELAMLQHVNTNAEEFAELIRKEIEK